MKVKVIDLLNKIANGEEVPNKIKWGVHEFKYRKLNESDKYYFCEEGINSTLEDYLDISDLHEEVEIIEEDKKIEKIKSLNNVGNCQNLVEFGDKQQLNNHILKDKINEIIDVVNKLKEEE